MRLRHWLAKSGLEVTILALLALAVVRAAADPPSLAGAPPRVFALNATDLGCRLRVGGKPGDLALRNHAVTAVVSRDTGWLVDFWWNAPRASSVEQLGDAKRVDGLWLLHPVLKDSRGPLNVVADSVVATADAIETRTRFPTGAGTVEITTSYRLDADQPRLLIESRVTHVAGGRIAHLSVGDRVKWGNVDYFVGGVGRQPFSFHGSAPWVGRQGAGGDLILRTAEDSPMRVDYKSHLYGSAPEIRVAYAADAISPGNTLIARRTLAYESISTPAKAPVPTGVLSVTITDEHGKPLAAKLTFTGVNGTANPRFGNDGGLTGANRFVWSGTGHFTRALPPGDYRVLATAGIERAAQTWNVTIQADRTETRSGRLPRVIDTPGWISADLHLHQLPSIDADIGLAERVVAIAAEGVEFAVASDHYAITDLAPTVAALQRSGALATPLQTMVGSEVSTVGHLFGHFNVFPLLPTDWIDYEDTTPRRLFAQIRQVAPRALLQVNHPRMAAVGYWQRYQLDPQARRVPARFRAEYDPNFDAIEVLNGYEVSSEPKLRQVLFDWMHLLGQGHRYAATGNSDSHKLFFVDPGVPRNLIHYGAASTDADDVKADPGAVVDAIRAGRVVVTTGPILDVDIDGVGPGGTVQSRAGHVQVHVRVRAAPWIDVRRVELLLGQNGHRVRWVPVPESSAVVRLDDTFDLRVPGDTFVVVYARGRRPLPNVYTPGVKPVAFTNPIWIRR